MINPCDFVIEILCKKSKTLDVKQVIDLIRMDLSNYALNLLLSVTKEYRDLETNEERRIKFVMYVISEHLDSFSAKEIRLITNNYRILVPYYGFLDCNVNARLRVNGKYVLKCKQDDEE